MKTAKKTKERSSDLIKATALATVVAKQFEEVWESLGKPKKLGRFQQVDFLDLINELQNVKYELISKTDGRPQPFDLSKEYAVTNSREKYPANALEDLDENAERMATFGECYERGCREIASIGVAEMSMDNLARLRDWIDAVIAWHREGKKNA